VDDLRPKPTQGWSERRQTWKDRLQLLLVSIGALSIVGIVLALVLPDSNARNQDSYERCIDDAATKAQGAVAIFNQIRSAKCDRLKPQASASAARFVEASSSDVSFRGYACTHDCSGHAAGYRWAQKKLIDDEDDCQGNSQSFIEGCLAYVEEVQQ
jgi:hypothetical protein